MNKGFSLMVIALMLVVLGGFVIMLMAPHAATSFDRVDATQKKLDKIRYAINTYYSINKSFPCPAGFTTPLSSANFGYESSANLATNCKSTAACAGVGIACPVSPAANKTWVGAVPIRAIGLADDYEFDGWGNRFTYAVNNNGKFVVNDINGTSAYVNFYAFSPGPDSIGAYDRAGNLTKTCTLAAGASATLSEYQNCNFSGASSDDTFLYRQWSNGPDFYDDVGWN